MKTLFVILIVLAVLCWPAQAGSVYDNALIDTAHVSVNAITADDIGMITTGAWDWNSDIDSMRVNLSYIEAPPRDTTTHYVVRIDSTWIVGKIECDTVPVNFKTVNDTVWAERLNIKCDTTYRQRHTFVWAPLVTVKLRPEQIEKLRELIAK